MFLFLSLMRQNCCLVIRIVKERSAAMEYASDFIATGMLLMQGLLFDEARQMCEDINNVKNDPHHRLSVAIEQFPKCVSIGGSHVMLDRVMNKEHSLVCVYSVFIDLPEMQFSKCENINTI